MSAHQMVCHLADSFRAALGEKVPSRNSGMFHRLVVKPFALYAPIQWPKGFPTRAEMDQERAGTRPVGFAEDMVQLLALIERFTHMEERPAAMHPMFGRMSRPEWHRWGYLHTDHHLRQFGV